MRRIADAVSQTARSSLVAQYNQIIQQITTTAQDSSFNGVNLLNGDTLKLVFNETGKSTSTIAGVTFDPNGLGLKSLVNGTDFIDNAATNSVLTALNTASTTLRSQASALRCQPLDRADPSGLLEEPDQRAADRVVQPDPGQFQRGSGQQPGAVDPPVDRGLRARTRQPVEPERSAAPALISANYSILSRRRGFGPAVFMWWIICGPMFWVGRHTFGCAQTPKVSARARTASSAHDFNFLNRPCGARMPGGVAGERPERSPPMPIVRGPELMLGRGDQSLCNGLKLGRPRMALPPDRFDFYPSFTHHFHSLFRMTSEPAWYRRISQADFISH